MNVSSMADTQLVVGGPRSPASAPVNFGNKKNALIFLGGDVLILFICELNFLNFI